MKIPTWIGVRKTVNVVLPLAALGVMTFYNTCASTCSSLTGNIFGLDMKYIGLIIPIPLVILALLNWDLLLLMALSFGVGAELKLVSFQIGAGTYCPLPARPPARSSSFFFSSISAGRERSSWPFSSFWAFFSFSFSFTALPCRSTRQWAASASL